MSRLGPPTERRRQYVERESRALQPTFVREVFERTGRSGSR